MKTDLKQIDPCSLEVFKAGALTVDNYREKVTEAEDYILSLPQLPMRVDQHFIPGIYTRELMIPAGSILTGSVHKETCMVIVSQGEIVVAMADGMKHIKAPFTFSSPPGHKRIAYALTDCKWSTVHPYFEAPKDEDEMKQVIGCDNYALYDAYLDQKDYALFVQQSGMTEEQITKQVEVESDMVDFDEKTEVHKGKSIISRTGLFASVDFAKGDHIGKATIGVNRTELGRYTNHSSKPNVYPDAVDGDCVFVALSDIAQGDELTVNYRHTTELRSQV